MGSEDHQHQHHHHHHHQRHHYYHQNLHIHHRSTFLPMLCSRPSINDVSLPRCRDPPESFSNEPLSPRIGCMGQVKRHNRIAELPITHRLSFTSTTTTTSSSSLSSSSFSPVVKYSKLKKLFSSKNLSTTTTTTATAPTVSSSGTRRRLTVNSADVARNQRCRSENLVSIRIEDMDPPLPVIKRVQKTQEGSQVDSLWKRRSGGVALKSLQLQQIHHPTPMHHLQPTSV